MKQFCPNCEKDSKCIHAAELYECQECGEDFAKYIVPRTNPDYYNHADIPAETSTVVNEPSNADVSMTQDVLMTIKTCEFCGQELTSTHQLHAIDHCAIHLKELLEAETKRADGLSEMVEMYKTMLKSKDIIIGNQERRINELAERLLKGGE